MFQSCAWVSNLIIVWNCKPSKDIAPVLTKIQNCENAFLNLRGGGYIGIEPVY